MFGSKLCFVGVTLNSSMAQLKRPGHHPMPLPHHLPVAANSWHWSCLPQPGVQQQLLQQPAERCCSEHVMRIIQLIHFNHPAQPQPARVKEELSAPISRARLRLHRGYHRTSRGAAEGSDTAPPGAPSWGEWLPSRALPTAQEKRGRAHSS